MRRSRKHQVISNYKDVELTSQRSIIGASIQSSCKRQESNYSYVGSSHNCLRMTRYYREHDSNQEIHFIKNKAKYPIVIDTANPCQ